MDAGAYAFIRGTTLIYACAAKQPLAGPRRSASSFCGYRRRPAQAWPSLRPRALPGHVPALPRRRLSPAAALFQAYPRGTLPFIAYWLYHSIFFPARQARNAAKQVRNAPGKAVASYGPQPHACKINGRGSRADSLAARVYFVRWDTPDRPPHSRHGREYARQPNARKGVCSAALSFAFTNTGIDSIIWL